MQLKTFWLKGGVSTNALKLFMTIILVLHKLQFANNITITNFVINCKTLPLCNHSCSKVSKFGTYKLNKFKYQSFFYWFHNDPFPMTNKCKLIYHKCKKIIIQLLENMEMKLGNCTQIVAWSIINQLQQTLIDSTHLDE